MRHDACTHPRTPAGRAACRKGAPEASQIAAETTTRVRRASRREPVIVVPQTFSGLLEHCRLNDFPIVTRPGMDPDTAGLTVTSPSGALCVAWRISDPAHNVASFRPKGTSVSSLTTLREGVVKLSREVTA